MATITEHTSDATAIRELHETFEAQKAAFLRDAYPSADERKRRVKAVADVLVANRQRVRDAMSHDFAVHPELFTDMVEVLGMMTRAQWAIDHLEEWMAPEERDTDPAMYGSGRAYVMRQPKGVVGNIVPWNFPFDLGMGPLIDALGAGNRVIIKPSEFTPACSNLMKELVNDVFPTDLVDVAVGGLDLAKEFTSLRWDHLLYTGNPTVGREVAKAAAANLVPVTLELGGKCPALVTQDAVTPKTIANIIGTKMIKNGQMCISVDYCLVPRDQVDEFVDLAKAYVAEVTPDYSATDNCPGIISDRHFNRLEALLDEARDSGAQIVQLDEQGALNPATRQMPLSIVVDPSDALGIMRDEIFGPILPIRPYDTVDEAIDYINSGERPLGLYVMTMDQAMADETLRRTSSGGFSVNACAMQGAIASLGFGGVGQSGIGRHHGIDGFREFSNPRGVFVRGENDLIDAFYAPYGERQQALVDAVLSGAGDAPNVELTG